MTLRPALTFHSDHRDPLFGAVSVSGLPAEQLQMLEGEHQPAALLHSAFRVVVAGSDGQDERLPPVAGVFHLLNDGFCFMPLFPFEAGLSYTATFNRSMAAEPDSSEISRLAFTPPTLASKGEASVSAVFPTEDQLPENLLRFYIEFSTPMQRGFAEANISVVDSQGKPAEDVLYRPPLELWDRQMQVLTVLLDPGRLKRGVGPNRELGPPLTSGEWYSLRIGRGMKDAQGQVLTDECHKTFYVTDPVRIPVSLAAWTLTAPAANSRERLVINFPRAMDYALALNCLAIKQMEGDLVPGSVHLNRNERCWIFEPLEPWVKGNYVVQVSPEIEDVCGNSLTGAFDRPLQRGTALTVAGPQTALAFHVCGLENPEASARIAAQNQRAMER